MRRLRRLTIFSALALAALCINAAPRMLTVADSTLLSHGDLVFIVTGDTANAIVLSTAGDRHLATDHVAIVDTSSGVVGILEAIPEKGVTETPWKSFVERAHSNGDNIVAARLRDTDTVDLTQAVERARLMLGRPYDDLFMLDTRQIYCSELVQLSYLDKNGRHIFTLNPMNFTGNDGQILPYWRERYGRRGLWVPQGALGTNPAAIAASTLLQFID